MNGLQKAQLQINLGTRDTIEDLDAVRIYLGHDKNAVKVLTTKVETTLRSGILPLKAIELSFDLFEKVGIKCNILVSLPYGYPLDLPASLVVENIANTNNDEVTFLTDQYQLSAALQNFANCKKDDRYPSLLMIVKEFENIIFHNVSFHQNQSNSDTVCMTSENDTLAPALVDTEQNQMFSCKYCGNAIFFKSDLHEHSTFFDSTKNHSVCTSYFLNEESSWSREVQRIKPNIDLWEESGKIECLKCNHKLGNWCWSGKKCSCNEWIMPAFQFVKAKIDAKLIR